MGCENISSKGSSNSISILVVDDDTTCLSLVATLLKKFKYEVVTAKHPNDALCALRIKGGAFDLVVSDVNMPDMNGFELKEAITHEFNLPVVLMSIDSQEGVASKGLKSGAAFFISKPVSPNDLKDLWQFATNTRKKRQLMSNNNKENPKRNTKKPKVIWTNGLNCRFLEAIRSIGLERSVPKRILEVMNVPGLTRENVASHLQKYRMFLKRVSNASYKVGDGDDEGAFITRNYSLQTLNKPHFPNYFPPSSSSSKQINTLIIDDEPVIPQINSLYTTNPSFHTTIDDPSILGQIPSQNTGISSELVPALPSTQNSRSYADFHSYVVENNFNRYLEDSSGGDYHSNPSPFCSVYDDLLLPSFDIITTTQQSFNTTTTHLHNNHQLSIQNQAQRHVSEYDENSHFNDDGIGLTNSSCDDHQAFCQQVEGFEESLHCDDALESLLAFGPFGEDQIQTIEGI